MNEYQRRLMDKPPITSDFCCFCGRRRANYHHVIPRSQGGGNGPVVPVCGGGNCNGCHGLLHAHKLHLDWRDGGWCYLRTLESMKYEKALALPGWKKVHTWNEFQA